MASGAGARNRERGQRREPKIHHHHRITSNGPLGNGLIGKNLGVHAGQLGEHRLNMPQVHAIDNLFNTHPAVQAACSVLHGQLLSGGLQVMRGGKRANLQPSFQAHLTKYWLPFARDIIDHLLKYGLVPFCFELEPEDLMHKAVKRVKRESDAPATNGRKSAAAKLAKPKPPRNQIPVVPMLGTYDIGWAAGGRAGYTRDYCVYSQAPGMTTKPDEECFVHVRQHPDGVGNINSPIASVFELGSFVTALTDLAYTAEVSRSLPAVTTQVRKPEKASSLDTGALFFDAESRAVAGGQQAEESESAANQLQMQAALMKVINQLQTHREGSDPLSRRQESGRAAISPPDIPPRLFVLPKVCRPAPPRDACARSHRLPPPPRMAGRIKRWLPGCSSPRRVATCRRSSRCRSTSSARPSAFRRALSSTPSLRARAHNSTPTRHFNHTHTHPADSSAAACGAQALASQLHRRPAGCCDLGGAHQVLPRAVRRGRDRGGERVP